MTELKLCISQLNRSGTKYNEEGYRDLLKECVSTMKFSKVKQLLIEEGLNWPKDEGVFLKEALCENAECLDSEESG